MKDVDTLILGCTHYPVLWDVIQRTMGPRVTLINSGAEAAKLVAEILSAEEPSDYSSGAVPAPFHTVLVSDIPRKFQTVGERFLGHTMPEARQVVWKESWTVQR